MYGSEGFLGIEFEKNVYNCPPRPDARLTAACPEYAPKDTAVGQSAAAPAVKHLAVSGKEAGAGRSKSWEERAQKGKRRFSGIVLAGGKSSRMGCGKAELRLLGKTLLEWQAEKLHSIGIEDIMLSGAECPGIAGARTVPDLLPDRGPLGGLHACLLAAENPSCVVLTVDTPLLPAEALRKLCDSHKTGVTVLCRNGKQEPLTGVYDRSVCKEIAELIEEHSAPVRALQERVEWSAVEYSGPEKSMLNCNTMEEFRQAEQYLTEHSILSVADLLG